MILPFLVLAVLTSVTNADETSCTVQPSKVKNPLIIDNVISAFGRNFSRNDFWEEGDDVYVCECRVLPCIRKCCKIEEHRRGQECVPGKKRFEPKIYSLDGNETEPTNVSITSFTIAFGSVCEFGAYALEPNEYPEDAYLILEDGKLYLPALQLLKDFSEFCIDTENDQEMAMVCFVDDDEPETEPESLYILYPIGLLISVPFLLATLLVYALIHELRNLHGLSLMSHVSSMIMAYVSLTVAQLGGNALSDGVCITTGFAIQFSFLACFFWLNVMCFDIWWTFSGIRPLRGTAKERDKKKFVLYSLYAWGCSAILLIITVVMDNIPELPPSVIRPNIGIRKCFFQDRIANLCYFTGPIALLLLANLIYFIVTAVKIVQMKKETSMLNSKGSQKHDDQENNKQRFSLYLKLFIVMGVNWIMEIISWAVGGPEYIWYLTDLGNTLQGVLIFVIFVCKPKILRLLKARICPKSVADSSGVRQTTPSRVSTSKTESTILDTESIRLKSYHVNK